jgi:preprotein translocase subunit SecD
MAVDANVIIFERIREELTLGRTPRAAVSAGFDRATLTILDANVTTLIAAVVLFQFGTGPVKGFAVTLSMGVIASMFTALILSRMIFDYILTGRRVKTLSI